MVIAAHNEEDDDCLMSPNIELTVTSQTPPVANIIACVLLRNLHAQMPRKDPRITSHALQEAEPYTNPGCKKVKDMGELKTLSREVINDPTEIRHRDSRPCIPFCWEENVK